MAKYLTILAFLVTAMIGGVSAGGPPSNRGNLQDSDKNKPKMGKSQAFQSYADKNGRKWSNPEKEWRRSIFNDNFDKIQKHNSQHQNWKMGINKFTGLLQTQFQAIYLNPVMQFSRKGELAGPKYRGRRKNQPTPPPPPPFVVATTIDWSLLGLVSPVKDQGACGSCWAFSTVATLQSMELVAGRSRTFSEQQIVDCSTFNSGCNGGLPSRAFQYLMLNDLVIDSLYAYTAQNGVCQTPVALPEQKFRVQNYEFVANNGECTNLYNKLLTKSISVGLAAANWSYYSSGVFDSCGTRINHAVLLVGANSKDQTWRIKNSWGVQWGENGYIRLKAGNSCRICQGQATVPIV